ncbi:hypothetical protein C8F01DRAFT_1106902 [Mycena amicta]|nr:hypothetical protein C8F01DRAFT_1106902 [Mycena amicta]
MSDQTKKPRHRHSAVQLTALNALYDQTEHPTLAQRTELAQSLGLCKQRASSHEACTTPVRKLSAPVSSRYNPILDDDQHHPSENSAGQFRSQVQHDHHQYIAPVDPEFTQDLSRANVDELQQIRRRNPYPTNDESRMIADRLQVHHSTIIDWFRMQHSRGRSDNHLNLPPLSEAVPHALRLPHLPPATSHPSLVGMDGLRRLSSVQEDQYYPPSSRQRSSSPRNTTPYGSTATVGTSTSITNRQRRGRPDSTQLEGLRQLLKKTPNPTIEERSALGREIGMDLVKVSNWFRNLRQSKAKRERRQVVDRGGSEDESHSSYAGSVSATSSSDASHSRARSDEASAAAERSRAWMRRLVHSSDDDEEAHEAVTPAPSPPVQMMHDFAMLVDEKAAFPSKVPYEDALLLLSFHQQAATEPVFIFKK